MSKAKRIIEDVKREKERRDKLFQGILFEKRGKEIVMFFEYEEVVDNVSDNHHFIRHNHDPEWVDKSMLPELKEGLEDLNVTYHCRKDIFI
ncbi:hypothetical protein [Staphylococcus simulans]|uniref:hypothetical protein n=1 Tax=Staphylococcus simulans TaxID=1286 RepID=UPI000D1FCE62|nr:hypothetical protein [Staphylococcus simulans]MDY5059496.1 hypothetical protein [Staphylococcus simulans]PTJ21235.1 hypothetical protein BU038_00270 [Staphylococcus simulans]RIN79328.1 hypothetical protein BU015_01095 [Staphylococcus simulans]